MKPIIITPSQRRTIAELDSVSASTAAVEIAAKILRAHQDPMVREAIKILDPALGEWLRRTRFDAFALVQDTGTDEVTVKLDRGAAQSEIPPGLVQSEVIVIGRPNGGGVTINPLDGGCVRIVITPVSHDHWKAAAPMPERIALSDDAADAWAWRLNGKVIEPRSEVTVTAGDVIEVERARITLEGAPEEP